MDGVRVERNHPFRLIAAGHEAEIEEEPAAVLSEFIQIFNIVVFSLLMLRSVRIDEAIGRRNRGVDSVENSTYGLTDDGRGGVVHLEIASFTAFQFDQRFKNRTSKNDEKPFLNQEDGNRATNSSTAFFHERKSL